MGRSLVLSSFCMLLIQGDSDLVPNGCEAEYEPADNYLEMSCCPYLDCEESPHNPFDRGRCGLHEHVGIDKRRGYVCWAHLERGEELIFMLDEIELPF